MERLADLIPIQQIAQCIGIKETELELYGPYKAKVSLDILKRIKPKYSAKYILVSAITPTHLGEGKTLTTIGLSMALNKIKKTTIACIRQPSLGPLFGIKGAATGGGKSEIHPMEDINLHFTGDTHAVSSAHNLLAAFVDNSLFRQNTLGIDPAMIFWKRVSDINDRFLRNVQIGLGSKYDGIPLMSGYDATAASEIMAILALSHGIDDLKKRLKNITVAATKNKRPLTADNLKAAGALAALLKDAIKPNLVATSEKTPCFVHTGTFGNIAHGNSSIIADKIALGLADFVVTEAGFGADCGAEKFFNIKCRVSKLKPSAVVLVCSVRALKVHSSRYNMKPGLPFDGQIYKEDLKAVDEGCINLYKQIKNIKLFGIPVVVCINRFTTDTDNEIALIRKNAIDNGAYVAIESNLWAEGSKGGVELAYAVSKAASEHSNFKFLYSLLTPIEENIRKIATKIYGAKDIRFSPKARQKLELFKKMNISNLPICMAKTQFSLSHDPNLKGMPGNFILPINDLVAYTGAGYITALCAKIQTMPGLPEHPAGEGIDVDKDGNITGLN